MEVKICRLEGEATKDRGDGIGLPIGQKDLLSHHGFGSLSYTMADASRRRVSVGEIRQRTKLSKTEERLVKWTNKQPYSPGETLVMDQRQAGEMTRMA